MLPAAAGFLIWMIMVGVAMFQTQNDPSPLLNSQPPPPPPPPPSFRPRTWFTALPPERQAPLPVLWEHLQDPHAAAWTPQEVEEALRLPLSPEAVREQLTLGEKLMDRMPWECDAWRGQIDDQRLTFGCWCSGSLCRARAAAVESFTHIQLHADDRRADQAFDCVTRGEVHGVWVVAHCEHANDELQLLWVRALRGDVALPHTIAVHPEIINTACSMTLLRFATAGSTVFVTVGSGQASRSSAALVALLAAPPSSAPPPPSVRATRRFALFLPNSTTATLQEALKVWSQVQILLRASNQGASRRVHVGEWKSVVDQCTQCVQGGPLSGEVLGDTWAWNRLDVAATARYLLRAQCL